MAAHSEFSLHLGEASKLLFPEDRARFENIGEITSMELSISRSFQGMEGLMYALDKIKNMNEPMKVMRSERYDLCEEIKELKGCKKELDCEQDSSRLKSALAGLATAQARVDMLEGRLIEIGLETEIHCRGKMAMEYRDNKASLGTYPKLLQMRAEKDARTSQLANSFEGMTTNDFPMDDTLIRRKIVRSHPFKRVSQLASSSVFLGPHPQQFFIISNVLGYVLRLGLVVSILHRHFSTTLDLSLQSNFDQSTFQHVHTSLGSSNISQGRLQTTRLLFLSVELSS
ncbi:hypothetical protein F8388_013992 [Cannabis sativa]|uniref:Uncharacterized protein n=1 Tax=Cannabis sativa TaxID=3483 RepID=A0A7J6GKR9_CANSA|nr:hypothetical protein G4B88_024807 [Cannabis sativa]KAF4383492.1 hypothetical protein F8388_013992 [Cannabis sativa]